MPSQQYSSIQNPETDHTMEDSSNSHHVLDLQTLPPEIVLQILLFLDIPDLFSLSRVSHALRRFALDPYLHHRRLLSASTNLEVYLPHRPPISSLRPPTSSILLSRTHLVARAVSRSLISIRLARNLSGRPSPDVLVTRHILPAECVGYFGPVAPGILQRKLEVGRRVLREKLRGKLERRLSVEKLVEANILPGELYGFDRDGQKTLSIHKEHGVDSRRHINKGYITPVSPGILEARRKLIKEDLKDGLRAWIEKRALLVQRRVRHEIEAISDDEVDVGGTKTARSAPYYSSTMPLQPRASVKLLVRRFTRSIQAAQQQQQQASESATTRNTRNSGSTNGYRKKSQCLCDSHTMQRRAKGGQRTTRWERPAAAPSSSFSSNGTGGGGGCSQPTRAHVLGLRRFWEGVIRSSA